MLHGSGPEGSDQVDLIGCEPGVGKSLPDSQRDARALGVRLRPTVCVAACPEAGDLTVDAGAAGPGVFEILQDQQAAAFADGDAVPIGVKRPARPRRFVVVFAADAIQQLLPHQAHGVDLALGAPADADVGVAPGDRAKSLTDSQMARHLAAGDGVRGRLGVVDDRDVAGEHVGQELQQPQRSEVGHPLASPFAHAEPPLLVRGGCQRPGQFGQVGTDQSRPDVDPESR